MVNARYATGGGIMVFDERSTTPKHTLGHTEIGNEDTVFVYCQATEAVSATCTLTTTNFTLTNAAGNFTADVPFAANEYGFVRQTGKLAP